MATYESIRYQFSGANIDGSSISAPTIADGSVTNTEFQTVDATSSIQTQLNTKITTSGATFTGNITLADDVDLNIGNGNDLIITSDGTTAFLQSNDLKIEDASGVDYMTFATSGAVTLTHGGSTKIATASTGATVTGTLAATTLTGTGAGITALAAANITPSGTLPSLVGTALTALNAANLTGTYAALNGGSITSLNATSLGSGTVPDARFPATLPTASAANLTSIPAGNLTGTVADARISTLTSSKLTGALPAIDGSSLTGIDTATGAFDSIGSLVLACTAASTATGATVAGSNLYDDYTIGTYNQSAGSSFSTAVTALGSSTLTGTWLCLGKSNYAVTSWGGPESGSQGIYTPGLFVRTS